MPANRNLEAGARHIAPIPAEILDQIVRERAADRRRDRDTASRRFKKALIERALGGGLTHHLGYPLGAAKPALARGRSSRS
jgi:putative transposase